jgi:hypothetical protein
MELMVCVCISPEIGEKLYVESLLNHGQQKSALMVKILTSAIAQRHR